MIPAHVREVLQTNFGLSGFTDEQVLAGGFRCLNISFSSLGQTFFIKQYREKRGEKMKEVKRAEQWFFLQGIPIILPLVSKLGEAVFFSEGYWYSVYPFVKGLQSSARELTPHHVASLGIMHARLHTFGSQADPTGYSRFSFWDREVFLRDVNEIERIVAVEPPKTVAEVQALENIRLQMEFLKSNTQRPEDFGLPFNHLLIDDFIYTNVFFDEEGTVKQVFDLERTGMGPRAYDLVRSLFITCFDDGWHEKNFEFARTYLKAYQTVYPIGLEEFRTGIQMYTTHFMHMTWLESAILLGKSDRHQALVGSANARLHHLLGNLEEIVEQMFVV